MTVGTVISNETRISRPESNAFRYPGREGLFLVFMPDDSMSGTIECGDALLASSFKDADNLWDGIYLYELNGYKQCRRIQVAGDKIIISSDSNIYQTIRLTKEEAKSSGLKILGMVRYHCQVKCIG